MDEPGLRRRIAAIERARGKHAVAKMRLFARVLFLEGHQEMAAEAAAALERLVRELGDPEAEEEGGEGGEAATEAEAEAEGGGGGEVRKSMSEKERCGAWVWWVPCRALGESTARA